MGTPGAFFASVSIWRPSSEALRSSPSRSCRALNVGGRRGRALTPPLRRSSSGEELAANRVSGLQGSRCFVTNDHTGPHHDGHRLVPSGISVQPHFIRVGGSIAWTCRWSWHGPVDADRLAHGAYRRAICPLLIYLAAQAEQIVRVVRARVEKSASRKSTWSPRS